MPGPRPMYPIELSEMQGTHLLQRSLSYTAPYAEVQRARILLLAHHRPTWHNGQIAQTVGCSVAMVKEWRRRLPAADYRLATDAASAALCGLGLFWFVARAWG